MPALASFFEVSIFSMSYTQINPMNTSSIIVDPLEALILARLNGEYDNPELLDFGCLDSNPIADITRMINDLGDSDTHKKRLTNLYLAENNGHSNKDRS